MSHQISPADQEFRRAFEACEFPADKFDHRAHVRLAYIYLCGASSNSSTEVDVASQMMKQSLLAFLAHLNVDPAKYHETITRAWVMAVKHFMVGSTSSSSADDFIDTNAQLLDPKIMLTHYSAEVLFSPGARQAFVKPDIQLIPEHR